MPIRNNNYAMGRIANRLQTGLIDFVAAGCNSNWLKDGYGIAGAMAAWLRANGFYQYGLLHPAGFSADITGTVGLNTTTWGIPFNVTAAPDAGDGSGWTFFSDGTQGTTAGTFWDQTAMLADSSYPLIARHYPHVADAALVLCCARGYHRQQAGSTPSTGSSAGLARIINFGSGARAGTTSWNLNKATTVECWTGSHNNGTSMTVRPGIYAGSILGDVAITCNNNYSTISTTNPARMVKNSFTFSAGTRSSQGWFGWCPTNGNAWSGTGSMFMGATSIYETGKTKGFRFNHFYQQGGKGAFDFALNDAAQATYYAWRHLFEYTCTAQVAAGQDPFICLITNDCFNFRNSTGRLYAATGSNSSTAAMIESVDYMLGTALRAWVSLGYNPRNLVMLELADFPTFTSFSGGLFDGESGATLGGDDATIKSYRETAHAAIAAAYPDNFCSIQTHQLVTRDELMKGTGGSVAASASSYYLTSGTDPNHLRSSAGYDFLLGRVMPAVMNAPYSASTGRDVTTRRWTR